MTLGEFRDHLEDLLEEDSDYEDMDVYVDGGDPAIMGMKSKVDGVYVVKYFQVVNGDMF